MRTKKPLTIKEKRDWLANIFRDTTGEFSQSEKFKAMIEDTRLATLPEKGKEAKEDATLPNLDFLDKLPPALGEQEAES